MSSKKKMTLKILENSYENTSAGVSLLMISMIITPGDYFLTLIQTMKVTKHVVTANYVLI